MSDHRYTTQPVQVAPLSQTVTLDAEPIVDLRAAANMLGYVLRATQRRRKLLLMTTIATVALVAALVAVMPRAYRIDSRIMTHKSTVMSALVHPDLAIPQSADAPTQGAVELIKSRENLERLLVDVDLKKLWDEKRSRTSRIKDDMLAKVFGKPSDVDLHEAYLTMLDDKIDASVEGEVVLLKVEWGDPDIAMRLANGVIARFLHMRHDMELGEIQQTVNILGHNVEASKQMINDVVKRMEKIFEQRENDLESRNGSSSRETRRRVRRNKFVAIRKPQGNSADSALARELAAKQTALAGARRGYEQRLKQAQDNLASLRASLGPDHPDVVEAKRVLEAVSKEPTELGAMEAEQQALATQLHSLSPTALAASVGGEPKSQVLLEPDDKPQQEDEGFDLMKVAVSEDLYKQMDKDPEILAVLDELKKRQDAHDGLVHRLANARIESETATIAFEFRYIITAPPVFPKKPVKPNVPVMLGGGLVAALGLGVMLAILTDVLSGRILEAWQVQRFLKVPMLGEIDEH